MTINIPNRRLKSILCQILQAGLQAADPKKAIREGLQIKGPILQVGSHTFNLAKFSRVVCVGAGKASVAMASTVEDLLGDYLEGGVVVVPRQNRCQLGKILIREAGHPLPDRNSVRAAGEILALVQSLRPQDLLLVLLSGGASSLLALPVPPVPLTDKQKTTRLLLRSGAKIQEINVIRKHLSVIKGGRLAEASSATLIGLLMSDVLEDDMSVIGSGPTLPDPSTFHDAQKILTMYKLWERIPQSVRLHLQRGLRGKIPDTPKPGKRVFHSSYHHLIGNNRLAVEGLGKRAKALGLRPVTLTTTLTGEAGEVGKMVGALAREIHSSGNPHPPPVCLIIGGELTVCVRGSGKGGRAQEFALSAAHEISGLPNTMVAGMGTDGRDGSTDVAGAVVDGGTLTRARRHGVDATKMLLRHDSYSFFKKVDGHIVTGPTGTNVNDIYLVLVL